jgi:tetratricopeptide (TPR) repeat protein
VIGGDRPGRPGDRPGRPGDRPEIGDRPGRPGDRPSIGGDRPGRPGDRPQIGDRPGRPGDRPNWGDNRPPFRPDRPGISGNRPDWGNNRPNWNNNQWNINNITNVNRNNWNNNNWNRGGYNRAAWGWGGGWHDNWYRHGVNPRWHGWYNGCWHGNWGNYWYQPLAWTAVGWGLGTWTSGWGYGGGYYNPYYTTPVVVQSAPYDYSQPVVVNVVDQEPLADDPAATTVAKPVAEDDKSAEAVAIFEGGLELFKQGEYSAALEQFDASLKLLPGDPVLHEVRALTLFALGNYTGAAAALNSLLSTSPGMDWTTLSGLYGNVDDYVAQVEKLQQHVEKNPNDAGAAFVMAYHYLVLGEQDDAIVMLQSVVKNQPKDVVAKRMLDTLTAEAAKKSGLAEQADTPAENVVAPADKPAGSEPETDLVGKWKATAGEATINLTIAEDFKFTWQAEQPDQPSVELTGELIVGSDGIVLQTEDQGAMAGKVTSKGADGWQFNLQGAPTSDPGLTFARVK